MSLYTNTGSLDVTVSDTTSTGVYSSSGSLRVTLVSGVSYVGVYAADGSMNVVLDTAGSGVYHRSGAIRGSDTTGSGVYSASGGYRMTGLNTPTALFSASEPGVWYDPSDVANTNWLYNLLTFTEQFDNSYWTKLNASVTANTIVAPDGTTTADFLIPDTANNQHGVYRGIPTNSGVAYTQSVYAKAGGYNWLYMTEANNVTAQASFNLATGVLGTVSGNGSPSATITAVGNGWYRCTLTFTPISTTSNIQARANNANGGSSFIGDGTSGIYIWGAQLELGSTATTYQPITTVDAGTIARFPLATLYQDIAGTTPVTAPNQPVGLMLSKDKGLVLGPEIVTNGNNETALYSGSGAINGTLVRGAAPGGGFAAVFTCNAGFLSHQALYQTIAANTPVQISVRMYVPTGSLTTAQLFDATDGSWSGASTTVKDNWVTLTSIRNAKATSWTLGMGQIAGQSIGGQVFYVDDLSIKALPGNHATQSTSGSRPTYGIVPATGRRNLLTYSEQFDNAAWIKSNATVTANVATAPDGTTTADKLIPSTVSGQPKATQSTTATAANNVVTVYAKPNGYNWIILQGAGFAWFDVANGVVGTQTSCTGSIQSVGNGWYRCQIVMTSASSNSIVWAVNGNGVTTFSGDGTSGVLFWGAQIENGSTATAYQKVVTAFEVTEANVASLSYISFDGVDDSMVTPTITPGTDKVQVFAGVRKLSDATVNATIAELGNATGSGYFFLAGPRVASTGSYRFYSAGTAATEAFIPTGYAAPITNVLTGFSDISGDVVTLRINGTQVNTSSADQGTGNYLANPMCIGRLGNVSNPFNGQMYGLITRFGANLDSATILRNEKWMGIKTGVTV